MLKHTIILAIAAAFVLSACTMRQSVDMQPRRITVSGDNAQSVLVSDSILTATRHSAEPTPGFIEVSIPVELKLTAHTTAGILSGSGIEMHIFNPDGKRLATLTCADDPSAVSAFLNGDIGSSLTLHFTGIVAKADFGGLTRCATVRITGFSFLQPRTKALLPTFS